jgi:hypothetical protein
VCYERGVAVWCGGMLETGIGRAANLALAAMPGFTLPGDTSASARYFRRDVTAPFELLHHRSRRHICTQSRIGHETTRGGSRDHCQRPALGRQAEKDRSFRVVLVATANLFPQRG